MQSSLSAYSRMMRRPPESLMPRQLTNDPETSEYGGTVTIVLSKFWTLMTVSEMSVTVPLMPFWGISIQSPMRSMSFSEIITPATSPRMGSLNTSIRTAVKAPSPVIRLTGDLSIRIETTTMTTTQEKIT